MRGLATHGADLACQCPHDFTCLACSRKVYGPGHDQAILSLGINADLRSVFNWNVKQLFAYVTAEYETEANVLNQV